LGNN